jgi:hypothetical protein
LNASISKNKFEEADRLTLLPLIVQKTMPATRSGYGTKDKNKTTRLEDGLLHEEDIRERQKSG